MPTAQRATNYKVLRYTRASDNDDEPWNQVSQATLSKLVVSADYWVVQRLTFPGIAGNDPAVRIETVADGADVHHVVFNRVLVEGLGNQSNYYGFSQACGGSSVYHDLTIQNSVFRNVGPWAPQVEAVAVDLQCGNNLRAVNNEIYDWVAHPIQLGHNNGPTLAGIVVENNDLYVTSALYTNGGTQAKTESPLSVKILATRESPARIIHNRIWGNRFWDDRFCCNGGDGDAIGHYDSNNYVLFQDNILFDVQTGVNNIADNNSFIGNIFWNIKQFSNQRASLGLNAWLSDNGAAAYEIYHNTFVDVAQYLMGAVDHQNVDMRCNAILASGPPYPAGWPTSAVADDNAFYGAAAFTFNGSNHNIDQPIVTRAHSASYGVGTILRTGPIENCTSESSAACFLYKVTQPGTTAPNPTPYCTTPGCTTTDGGITVQAVRGPYKFYRKLRSSPEEQIVPYAAVHSSAEDEGWCPSGIGSRSLADEPIGINNDAAGNGILSADITGAARSGTAGALESAASSPPSPPPPGQSPYPGPNPGAIPGTIQAENFDNGGEGVAYHDNEPTNWGNAPGYRPTSVDIEADQGADNGHFVAVTAAGEWLEYTVDVPNAGDYTLEVRVASNGNGGTFHIEFDGANKTGAIAVPNTGGWFIWQTLTRTVNLSAGTQIIMRIALDTNGPTNSVANIDYVRLTTGSTSGPTGTVTREFITDLPDNIGFPDFNAGASGSEQLTSVEGPTNWAERYATRIRGYVHPPITGAYTFWLASDDDAELRLSSDEFPSNVSVIASVSGWTDPLQWNKFASQQSSAIQLQAGQR